MWAALLLGAALLTSGCVTLAPRPGAGTSEGAQALSPLRETGVGTPPLLVEQEPRFAAEPGELQRLHRRRSARGLDADVALASTSQAPDREVASGWSAPQGRAAWGGQEVPPGWPDFSARDKEALLAPFLACASPAEFLALQERVDMPRLVEALDDWRAVRLGAQGPPREDVARLLNLKRARFLVEATEEYGAARAQVLALFLVHSSHDDDLREVLFLLARDKQLEETLTLLPAFQRALERRGLAPTARADRDFQLSDVGRGLARAGRDALATAEVTRGLRELSFSALYDQLPPDYQRALDEVDRQGRQQFFSPANVALGSFDHLTFGVPLSFYGLLAGTGQGANRAWKRTWA